MLTYKYGLLRPNLDERGRRLWAASEASFDDFSQSLTCLMNEFDPMFVDWWKAKEKERILAHVEFARQKDGYFKVRSLRNQTQISYPP